MPPVQRPGQARILNKMSMSSSAATGSEGFMNRSATRARGLRRHLLGILTAMLIVSLYSGKDCRR